MMRRVSARPLLASWEHPSFDDHDTAAVADAGGAPQGGCISSSDESSSDNDQDSFQMSSDPSDDNDAPFLSLAATTTTIALKRKRPPPPPIMKPRTEDKALDGGGGTTIAEPSLQGGGTDAAGDNYCDNTTANAESPSFSVVSPWAWLPEDAAAHICGYLDLADVRHFSQAQSSLLRASILGNDHVWREQAQHLWHLPHLEHWNSAADDDHSDGPSTFFPWRSPSQLLALATQKSLPNAADASIFAPSRWSYSATRTLRSRTVVRHAVRGSLQKEFEVVVLPPPAPVSEGGGTASFPAVRFLGPIGHGDRSIRANAPLPRPTKILSSVGHEEESSSSLSRRLFWRTPPSFLRRLRSSSTGSTSSAEDTPATTEHLAPLHRHHHHPPPQSIKWQPFVAPWRLGQTPPGNEEVWDVTPRLVSYFEVEILPPTATTTAESNAPGSTTANAFVRHTHAKECVAVGLATDDFALHSRMPGWDRHSWGFHGDDAGLFHGAGTSVVRDAYGPTYGRGDVVGCGVDWVTEHIFFTLNGVNLGPAFDLRHDRLPGDVGDAAASVALEPGTALYPVVGIDTHDLVRMNLTGPFVYDVQQRCREQWPTVREALQHKAAVVTASSVTSPLT